MAIYNPDGWRCDTVESHGLTPITGMRGYHLYDADSDVSLRYNVEAPETSECIADIFSVMRSEVGGGVSPGICKSLEQLYRFCR